MNKDDLIEVINILKATYPDAKCSLDFNNAFELGIAVALAAQCTDERVNKVTANLFKKYNKPEDFVNIEISELEELIRPCGFYKNKAKNIKQYSKQILEQHNGEVPRNMGKLMGLAGLGRKSANVIMLEAFGDAQRNSSRYALQKNS